MAILKIMGPQGSSCWAPTEEEIKWLPKNKVEGFL
jgi:hypothetical protein